MKKALALVIAVILAVFALYACGAPGAGETASAGSNATTEGEAGEIVIGGLAPLTGDVSVYGIATNNGAQLAVKQANEAGKNIKYVSYDEKGDATEAVNAYNKLVENDKIVALVGDVTSKPTQAVAQQTVKDNMPMITGTGTAANITEVGENVFRACFIDPFQGEVMANYAATELGVKKAAILYDIANDYSVGLTDSFTATAKEKGVEIVASEGYTGGDVDFKSQLTKIASSGAEALFIPVYYQDVALIAKQAKEVGITAQLLGADGWDSIIEQVDASNMTSVEGAIFCNHYSKDGDDADLKKFIEAYKAEYNEEPNQFAALGYDAMNIMIAAIEKAGSTDSAAIIEALKNTDFKGVTSSENIKFDENRNPVKSAALTQIKDGEYKFLEYYSN